MLFVYYTEEEKSTMMMDLLVRNTAMLRSVIANQSMMRGELFELKQMINDIRSTEEKETSTKVVSDLVDSYNELSQKHIDFEIKNNESYLVDIIDILRNMNSDPPTINDQNS